MSDENEKTEWLRKTIMIDEKRFQKCELMMGEGSFSELVRKAIDCYINCVLLENEDEMLSKSVRKALSDEVRPIASRLSKGLYRYAIEIEMMYRMLFSLSDYSDEELNYIRKAANASVAKMRGKIDLKQIMEDNWRESEDKDDD